MITHPFLAAAIFVAYLLFLYIAFRVFGRDS